MNCPPSEAIEILLVDDSPGDVRLTLEALRERRVFNAVHVVTDGEQALRFLAHEAPYEQAPRPNLILLDLNLPRVSGREVLGRIKADPALRGIPVVVLTTSGADEDVVHSYQLNANCYVTKPVDFDRFIHLIHSIDEFWLSVVQLPSRDPGSVPPHC
jgi:chemotaxis family two-component system response regulator Rcp1